MKIKIINIMSKPIYSPFHLESQHNSIHMFVRVSNILNKYDTIILVSLNLIYDKALNYK